MFNIIVIAILSLIGLIGLSSSNEPIHIAGIVFLCLSLVWTMASLLNNFSYYSDQLRRFEDLRASLKKMEIYKKMESGLLEEFKNYLGEKYPELEERIFKAITDNKSDVHVILKYPELKASKTLMKLTNQINDLAEELYDRQKRVENECADIRYFTNGKWELIMPNIPEDLKDIIYPPIEHN